ncbi:adenylate kinase [Candidatus Falkowbacteria bacterium]|nr:adenylate kinase [Candidatus Falkowbacteria bacterium]
MKKTMMIFLGPPGSGKGTQTAPLSEKLDIPVISTGALFREEVEKGTNIGKLVEEKMNNGELISTDITNEILEKRLESPDTEKGFILDGYPRKEDQIDYALKNINKIIDNGGQVFVFYIDVSDSTVNERITGRRSCDCGKNFHTKFNPPKESGICDDCHSPLIQRGDDSEEAVVKRLEEFHKGNKPVLEFFQDKKYFYRIDGERDIEEIREEIEAIINKD